MKQNKIDKNRESLEILYDLILCIVCLQSICFIDVFGGEMIDY